MTKLPVQNCGNCAFWMIAIEREDGYCVKCASEVTKLTSSGYWCGDWHPHVKKVHELKYKDAFKCDAQVCRHREPSRHYCDLQYAGLPVPPWCVYAEEDE